MNNSTVVPAAKIQTRSMPVLFRKVLVANRRVAAA
jgi:hypothetical protein